MNESGKYTPEQALEEADAMKELIGHNQATNYQEASTLISQKDIPRTEITPEQVQADIRHKSELIRAWAHDQGLIEGRDIRIIESIRQVETDTDNIAPDEDNRFFVIVQERYYDAFKEYITGPYMEQRRHENPTNRNGGPKLDYSWGGRFAVGWDGATIDTAPAIDVEQMSASTHQQEFEKFYYDQTGKKFPTSETINPILRELGARGLDQHIAARDALKSMRQAKNLPYGGADLLNELERTILIFEDAASGEAVQDLPETLHTGMPARMRHYADLTYNAEHIQHLSNYERIKELTGINILVGSRLTDLFSRIEIQPAEIDAVCKDFSDFLTVKRKFEKQHSV